MSLFDVGRVCVKIAGRDAGQQCVVVERLDNTYVVVDGATRRRKVNIRHLEPLAETLDISSGANHAAVVAAFRSLKVAIVDKKSKNATARQVKQKIKKAAVNATDAAGLEIKKEKKSSVKKTNKKLKTEE